MLNRGRMIWLGIYGLILAVIAWALGSDEICQVFLTSGGVLYWLGHCVEKK